VDVVFDVYSGASLKQGTRERRGTGKRKRVELSGNLPTKQWRDFLRVDGNKSELFSLLAEAVASMVIPSKQVLATSGENVLSSSSINTSNLSPCTHEEADARLVLHAIHAANENHQKIKIRTVDSDVVIIAVSAFRSIRCTELWVTYGTGPHIMHLPIHEIAASLSPSMCRTLPLFHAFTGCDTVSSFAGKGKKTAWATWTSFPEVTEAFLAFLLEGEQSEDMIRLTERFVILMYDRTSPTESINEARKMIFSRRPGSLENIPPTRAALEQHLKRAILQARLWNSATCSHPPNMDPAEWGWIQTAGEWKPLWTTLPEASKICQELIHCGCKKSCTGRCKCKKAELKRTSLCHCGGDC
jgi:hypothetical protein